MSRGLGLLQRRAVLFLWRSDGHHAPLSEVKRAMGVERANSRRAIRALVERGMVAAPEGQVSLTSGG